VTVERRKKGRTTTTLAVCPDFAAVVTGGQVDGDGGGGRKPSKTSLNAVSVLWKPQKQHASTGCTSLEKCSPKFSSTIPLNGEEGQDVRNEVTLVIVKAVLPVR